MWGYRAFPMASEGKFEFKNVQPGQYFIQTIPMNLGAAVFGVKQLIEVGEEPVESLQIPALTPFEVTVRFLASEGELPALAGTRLLLTAADEVLNSVPMATVADKHQFPIAAVFPDRYSITASGLPEGLYIQKVKCGDRISDERAVDIVSPAEPVEIVLGTDGARVAGTVTNPQGDPVRGAWVVLLHGSRKVDHRTARANEKGEFSLAGVAPGEYRAFALEHLDPGAVDDDEQMAPYLGQAVRLKIAPKSQETVTLKLK
jgi:hypothetical protein